MYPSNTKKKQQQKTTKQRLDLQPDDGALGHDNKGLPLWRIETMRKRLPVDKAFSFHVFVSSDSVKKHNYVHIQFVGTL